MMMISSFFAIAVTMVFTSSVWILHSAKYRKNNGFALIAPASWTPWMRNRSLKKKRKSSRRRRVKTWHSIRLKRNNNSNILNSMKRYMRMSGAAIIKLIYKIVLCLSEITREQSYRGTVWYKSGGWRGWSWQAKNKKAQRTLPRRQEGITAHRGATSAKEIAPSRRWLQVQFKKRIQCNHKYVFKHKSLFLLNICDSLESKMKKSTSANKRSKKQEEDDNKIAI